MIQIFLALKEQLLHLEGVMFVELPGKRKTVISINTTIVNVML